MKRNDICLCGSGKKYKKCCINKEIELAETIEYNIARISEDKKTATEKIKEMDYEDKINFLGSLLSDKKVKCLDCKESHYIGQGVETYAPGVDEKYQWFYCNKCDSSICIEFNGNFITEISDLNEIEAFSEDYEDLILNNDRDDFFGLDFEDIVLPKLTVLQIRKPGFMSLPANGEFKLDDEGNLVFNMLGITGENIPFILGARGENGLDDELFNNLDKIRGKVLQVDDTFQIVMVLSNGDEEEAESELNKLVSLEYMNYRGIENAEDMVDLLEEADIAFMTMNDFVI